MALNRSLAPWTSNPRGALAISSGLGMRPLMERVLVLAGDTGGVGSHRGNTVREHSHGSRS